MFELTQFLEHPLSSNVSVTRPWALGANLTKIIVAYPSLERTRYRSEGRNKPTCNISYQVDRAKVMCFSKRTFRRSTTIVPFFIFWLFVFFVSPGSMFLSHVNF